MKNSFSHVLATFVLGVFVLGVSALLGGCETVPPGKANAEISFAHLPPIVINVATVEIVHEYRPSYAKPNVEHLFPVTPAAAMERWAKERLRPMGASGVARFVIMDASVKETKLEKKKGLVGLVTKNPSERYDAIVRARIDVVDASGRAAGMVSGHATRYQTVIEGISPNDRAQAWFDMTSALLADFDREMERNTRELLGNWVR